MCSSPRFRFWGRQRHSKCLSLAKFPGDVESWELVEIGAESRAPFTLPELHEKLAKKRSELRIETEKNSNFAGDNKSLFDEYQKKHAENP